jgi:hypothetical protein
MDYVVHQLIFTSLVKNSDNPEIWCIFTKENQASHVNQRIIVRKEEKRIIIHITTAGMYILSYIRSYVRYE